MNQRFELAVIMGAVFLATFVATALILLILGVALRDREPVADSTPATRGQAARPQAFTLPDTSTPPAGWRDNRFSRYRALPDGGSVIDGYRFRPLEKRELRRFGGWADSRESGSTDWPGTAGRGRDADDRVFGGEHRLPEDFTSGWGETPYRFRPTEPERDPGDPGRRPPVGPPGPGGFPGPGFLEPPRQWGATPSVLPPPMPPPLPDLYPSLVPPNDHRLTVR